MFFSHQGLINKRLSYASVAESSSRANTSELSYKLYIQVIFEVFKKMQPSQNVPYITIKVLEDREFLILLLPFGQSITRVYLGCI